MKRTTQRASLLVCALVLLSACEGPDEDDPDVADEPQSDVTGEDPDATAPSEGGATPDDLEQPTWAGPPDDVIGSDVAFEPMRFDGDEVVVAVTGMTAYAEGVELRATVRRHPDAVDREPGTDPAPADDPLRMTPRAPAEDEEDEQLRLVVTYPDGRTASTADHPTGEPENGEPEAPMLTLVQSVGTPGVQDYTLWLWPMPEADGGSLEISAEWPAEGLERASAALDLEQIRAAADRSVELWENAP